MYGESEMKTYNDPRKAAWERAKTQTVVESKEPRGYFIPLSDRGLANVSKDQLVAKIAELSAFESHIKLMVEFAYQIAEISNNNMLMSFGNNNILHKIRRERERMLEALETKKQVI